eukprot:CAMPEP_0202690932 /NCGR_PEP_ID=MMETSP1385-20130828/5800_1 /ASSEMBLY_ACC=CAM_ASM_000861 /TAXON_ID=933848 /ORGANISM="Elphidium margaritaceum" /LENGTH=795 /DNA_ID=CAMNT_0049346271 /DNA_START=21 /DNA_END=2408 /DNA_ORIENTATION=+
MAFERLGVIPEIIKATHHMQWLLPTPVQDEAIPLILGGGDVMVAAETGSGKTAAFGIPILQTTYETLRGEAGSKRQPTKSASRDQKAGGDALPPITLSETTRDKTFIVSGLKGSSTSSAWVGGRASLGVVKGKYYYEINVISGAVRVGWCTTAADHGCGTDSQGFGYGYTGKKANDGNFDPYGQQFGAGDYVGCYIDFNTRSISFTLNGVDCGAAFSAIPNMGNSPMFPCVTIRNGSVNFNFGRAPFRCAKLKAGFRGIQNAKREYTSLYFRELAIEREASQNRGGRGSIASPLALIVAPTRDLATQIHADILKLGKFCDEPPIYSTLMIGGGGGGVARSLADMMKAQLVIGTIGSLVGSIKSRKLTLSCCKFFVIDEADRILDPKQGSQSDVLAMYSRLPSDVQVIICSATLHSDPIREMTQKLCRNPTWVDLKGKDFVPDTVHHCILVVDPIEDRQWTAGNDEVVQAVRTDGVHERDHVQYNSRGGNLSAETKSEAVKLLKPLILKKIIDAFKMDQCLIFCRTRVDCDNLEAFLTSLGGGRKWMGATASGKENPYSCIALHSGIAQHLRNEHLANFKSGDVRFLIATDVAARGIDIKALPYVINLTMPAEDEDYIHRVGRVGRADQPGIAISIISTQKEKVWYHANCPDRGRNCSDTRLVPQGGCCIWYDEVKIFEAVEKRLGGAKIPILDQHKHLSSTAKITDFVKSIEQKDPLISASEKKLKKLLPTIQQLNSLEVVAQNQYLVLPHNFTNIFNSTQSDFNLLQAKINKKKKKTHRGKKKKKNNDANSQRG